MSYSYVCEHLQSRNYEWYSKIVRHLLRMLVAVRMLNKHATSYKNSQCTNRIFNFQWSLPKKKSYIYFFTFALFLFIFFVSFVSVLFVLCGDALLTLFILCHLPKHFVSRKTHAHVLLEWKFISLSTHMKRGQRTRVTLLVYANILA